MLTLLKRNSGHEKVYDRSTFSLEQQNVSIAQTPCTSQAGWRSEADSRHWLVFYAGEACFGMLGRWCVQRSIAIYLDHRCLDPGNLSSEMIGNIIFSI